MWKVSGGASSSSESAEEGGTGGGWNVYVVKRDLSRKAEAARGRQWSSQAQAQTRTLHNARLVNGELQALVAYDHVCLGCECDAAEQREQLARGAGHSGEDGWLVLHGGAMGAVGQGSGSKCYCIPIDYSAGQDIKELNVDADCADHVHCAETGGVSRCGAVLQGAYPNATEAGAPTRGRLANERSVSVSESEWWAGEDALRPKKPVKSSAGHVSTATRSATTQRTGKQQRKAEGELAVLANGGLEGRRGGSLPDVCKRARHGAVG
ncbi:hypothetical protein OPT61_g10271 [Boeremia exigua]|uniref:Uncharacterized protein n=1 Tax=Boeremia exigua TaxID=749465 RepID=A0ACC2HQF2_9PLEO|nr:hypothetical protein OPT61_g10271 [Boeremia exigua]